MNPDYQMGALYGDAPNSSAIDATMLNPASMGPDDWTTVLTNGISGAAFNGINGMIKNAVDKGQIKNAGLAKSLGVGTVGGKISISSSPVTLIFFGALLYFLVK